MMYTLGIDVGSNGGFALIDEDKNIVRKGKLGMTSQLFNILINGMLAISDNQLQVCLERPFMLSKQGGVDTMYINYGRLLAVLELKNIPYIECKSQQWIKYLGLAKESKKDKPSTRYIPALYPDLDFRGTKRSKKVHDGITDSVCIAIYGQSVYA